MSKTKDNEDTKKITVEEFEEKFEKTEGFPIIVRAPRTDIVDDYNYSRAINQKSSLKKLKETRISKSLGEKDFVILDGDFENPHGRTSVESLRKSYEYEGNND